jgi:chromosome condensin MukBEF ATPase and DNA-binding subunit MukB
MCKDSNYKAAVRCVEIVDDYTEFVVHVDDEAFHEIASVIRDEVKQELEKYKHRIGILERAIERRDKIIDDANKRFRLIRKEVSDGC